MGKAKKAQSLEEGQKVSVHYVGTLESGEEFDNSRIRNEPLAFEVGAKELLQGFSQAVVDMSEGEVKNITLTPEEAYGQPREDMVQKIPREYFNLAEGTSLETGTYVYSKDPSGNPVRALIKEVGDEAVTLDFNHPLAGETINFEIELVSVDQE